MSEVELRLRFILAKVSESKFDVGNLLRRGLTSSDLYLDLITGVGMHEALAKLQQTVIGMRSTTLQPLGCLLLLSSSCSLFTANGHFALPW